MDTGIDPIIERAIEAAGGTAILAQRLGIQAPSIYSWRRVPPNRVLAVEAATGISRHALRPDLYPPDIPKRRARRPEDRAPTTAAPPSPEPVGTE
jgi:DNA-binding transcriptional regulator YdaS (Cro superfamily)